jgi:hypothetical protein
MRPRRALSLALLLAPLAGCGEGVSAESGLSAYLRASGTGAQFVPGELTTEPRDPAPTIETIRSGNTQVFPGAQGRSAGGTVSTTSSAVLIGLEGDSGHWLVPVGVREAEPPNNFTFSSTLSFSPDLPTGKRALIFRAVDPHGAVGPVQALDLDVVQPFPSGNLVIELVWDTEADLDLHLRIPNPNAKPDDKVRTYDVWARAPRALPPRPQGDQPYTQAELDAGGRLLFDSNGQCVIDGQRHEEVVFPGAIPAGPIEVRVDTFSLCGEPTARWWVGAMDSTGAKLIEKRGQSSERDTFATHGADSGTLAFTLP